MRNRKHLSPKNLDLFKHLASKLHL